MVVLAHKARTLLQHREAIAIPVGGAEVHLPRVAVLLRVDDLQPQPLIAAFQR